MNVDTAEVNSYIFDMLKKERIGYGYERSDRSFKGHNCDLVVIDTKGTQRDGRRDVMQRLREGSTLVIFSWKELAPGRLKEPMQAELDRMGVTVELLEIPDKPTVKPSQRGLSGEAKAHALPMWRKPTIYSVEYVRDSLNRAGLGVFTRNQLNYALGPRTPPADEPLGVEE